RAVQPAAMDFVGDLRARVRDRTGELPARPAHRAGVPGRRWCIVTSLSPAAPIVSVDGVDADWMTAVLAGAGQLASGASVVDLRREPCGTGQLGDSYRFSLTYDVPSAGPATVVGKFASEDATSREFGRSSGYYRSE